MKSLLTRNRNRAAETAAGQQRMSDGDFAVFQRILYDQSGIVLSDAKRALVESRVNQRLRAHGMGSFSAYLAFLEQDATGEELVHLIDVISTNITNFFREEDHFALLDRKVGEWTEQGMKKLRVWSAACSTGEEPYTLAMTLYPHLVRHRLDLKILATDISTRVLARANTGLYDAERLSKVPDDLRTRYFTRRAGPEGEVYAVSDELKRMIMFRRLNFTVFPYRIKGVFDVIMCRNAMIYFDRTLRAKMVQEFARLLRPGGLLMIGHAETLMGIESSFKTVKPSVYLRNE